MWEKAANGKDVKQAKRLKFGQIEKIRESGHTR